MVDRIDIALFSKDGFTIWRNQDRTERMAPKPNCSPGDLVGMAKMESGLLRIHPFLAFKGLG